MYSCALKLPPKLDIKFTKLNGWLGNESKLYCGAGDDGDSSLMKLVDFLSLLQRQVHREENLQPGGVQVDRQYNLDSVTHCKILKIKTLNKLASKTYIQIS